MRRSRSSSNIPIPTFKRTSSNENLGSSQKCPRTSQQGLTRSNSSNNLFSAKKSLFVGGLNEDARTSISRFSNRRITATPLRTPLRELTGRKISATPLSHNKMNASPFVMLTTSKINDKRFIADQHKKICSFLEQRIENFDPKSLKPINLSFFVQTMSMLFKEIEPRININMANYKEIVFKYLKLYKYPGLISMSLLKSVNTSLSWANIMSIFGWLVDLIHNMTNPPYEDPLQQYVLERAEIAFGLGSDTCSKHIEDLLGFDKAEIDIVFRECQNLKHEVESKRLLIEEKKQKEKITSDQLDRMKLDIKEFKEDDLQSKLKDQIEELQSEYKIRVAKFDESKQSIADTHQIISNQKYSFDDKQKLLNKLEDEKYSLSLKKDELENIYKFKYEIEYELTNLRRQVETKIHEINGQLLQINLGNYIEDVKKIRLPDRCLSKPEFMKEIEEKKELLKHIGNKIDSESTAAQEMLSKYEKQHEELCYEVEKNNKEVDILTEKLENIKLEQNRVLFEFDVQKKAHANKVAQLRENAPDVVSMKKKKSELEKEVLMWKEKLEILGIECIKACQKIHAETREKAIRIRATMEDLTAKAEKAYEMKEVTALEEIVVMLDNHNTRDY